MKSIRLAIFLSFAALPSLAASPPPQDYVGVVTNQIDALTTNFNPIFLTTGKDVFHSFAVVMLIVLGLRIARQSRAPLDELMSFFFLFLLGEAILRFWDRPMPLFGFNTHQLIPKLAYDLAKQIDLQSIDLLTSQITHIVQTTPAPSFTAPLELMTYMTFMGLLGIVSAILFALTILGFVAIGLGTLVGPLLIPFILVPKFNWLFYNWLSFTIKYSFYQIIANGLVFIWANVFVTVLTNLFGPNFAIAHLFTETVALLALSGGMAASIFYVTHWVNDLFTGSAHTGGVLAGTVKNAVQGAFR